MYRESVRCGDRYNRAAGIAGEGTRPRGATQSMNVGNARGTSRPPFLGFHCFQNWHMYNHRSDFWLIFLNCFSAEGGKSVEIVPNIVWEI